LAEVAVNPRLDAVVRGGVDELVEPLTVEAQPLIVKTCCEGGRPNPVLAVSRQSGQQLLDDLFKTEEVGVRRRCVDQGSQTKGKEGSDRRAGSHHAPAPMSDDMILAVAPHIATETGHLVHPYVGSSRRVRYRLRRM